MVDEKSIIYEGPYLRQDKSYTTAELRQLKWEYVTDATSTSRSVREEDVINRFLDWLDRESKAKR